MVRKDKIPDKYFINRVIVSRRDSDPVISIISMDISGELEKCYTLSEKGKLINDLVDKE